MNKEWLTEHFRDRKLSIQECATIAQCNIKRIDYWLQRFGLKPITNELRKKLHEEQNHPSIRKTMNRGYIWVYLSRGGKNGDYIKIPEHRWLLQQHLKRELTKSERIHHLNGVKTDNRIENLMLFSNDNEHARFEGKVSFFVKQLLWGNLNSELRDKLFPIFTEFLSRFDQDISA